jgi:hypothetical protein
MVLAMDRSKSYRTLSTWIVVGLTTIATNSGCSQLKSQLWGESRPPAELGQTMESDDIYAQAHRPGSSLASGAVPAGTEVSTPALAQYDEVGMAMRPAEIPADHSVSGVSLQPPTSLDARSPSRPSPASLGVPNASKILASAERRPEPVSRENPSEIVAEARKALDALTNYQVSLHRQERVNGTLLPEEDVVLAIRREPRAVRLTWTKGSNQGREVLYRADDPSRQMQIKMANPALPRLSLAPESPMVMRNSRHPVTEAGFDSLVEGLENALKDPSNAGLTYSGPETAEGLDGPHPFLIRKTPSGETWKVHLDPQTHLPSMVLAVDSKGDLLERYLFKEFRPNLPELALAEAFDANARWGQPRGLFGRLAKGESPEPPASPR